MNAAIKTGAKWAAVIVVALLALRWFAAAALETASKVNPLGPNSAINQVEEGVYAAAGKKPPPLRLLEMLYPVTFINRFLPAWKDTGDDKGIEGGV